MARKKKAQDPNHLGFGRLLAFKSSDVVAAWVNLIALNYLSVYASDTLGISVMTVGTLLLISKIVDAFTDVFAGWLVDNTHTKLGTGRTYEPAIVGMTICTVLLFSASPEWSNFVKCAWIFCMYTFIFSIFATLRLAGYNPYTIRHFSNNTILIRKVASYGGIITMGGSILMSIGFPILMGRIATSASGWTRLLLVIMIPATLIGLLRFFLCKEDPSVTAGQKQQKVGLKELGLLFRKNKYVWFYAIIMLSYNIVTNLAVNTYYFKYIIGNTDMIGVMSAVSMVILPVMLTFPAIMKKIGSMGRMLAMFCLVGMGGYLAAFFIPNLTGALIGGILGALATTPVAYYGILFVMNICNYNEMLGLQRMEACSSILSNFASKFGGALGAWITGLVLSVGGYISSTEAVTQPASALLAIRIDFALIPVVLLAVIGVCSLAFAKLEPKTEAYEAEKKAKIEAQKAEADSVSGN